MSLTNDSSFEVSRPWGKFIQFTHNSPSTVKIITVNPGEAFSLQYHNNREEFWYIISGSGKVEIGDEVFDIQTGQKIVIPKGTKHRVTGGTEPVIFLEVSTGDFDEEDIVRLEDRYGRVK